MPYAAGMSVFSSPGDKLRICLTASGSSSPHTRTGTLDVSIATDAVAILTTDSGTGIRPDDVEHADRAVSARAAAINGAQGDI